ncbi:MAG: class I SAM-dependent methyltransferase, partial [Candidatus Binataceae bacterium]
MSGGSGGAAGKAAFVRAMFARIVPRYDLVNRLMTMGLDRRWRRETAAMVRPSGAFALDIATGTGDLALELARQGARRVVGADFGADMLTAATAKAARAVSAGSRGLG